MANRKQLTFNDLLKIKELMDKHPRPKPPEVWPIIDGKLYKPKKL